MKFGKVEHPETIDFTLPEIHPDTIELLTNRQTKQPVDIYVGCATWNKQALKHFYPKGTKDELTYYSTQFNSIELNASYYRIFPKEQFEKWASKVGPDFKFFPKLYQGISHWKRLRETELYVEEFDFAVSGLGEKLECCFVQMHDNFSPNAMNIEALEQFARNWPSHLSLAIELRNTEWFINNANFDFVHQLFTKFNISTIITDSAGRRDIVHLRLSTPTAFVRYVGTNHPTDYTRIDTWLTKIIELVDLGLEKLYFFVHQETELETVQISRELITKLNRELKLNLPVPRLAAEQGNLFN